MEEAARRENERAEELARREKARAEDVAWREKVRAEDVAWQEETQRKQLAAREAFHAQSLLCLTRGLALIAAAQNAKPGTLAKELARRAQDLAPWIGEGIGKPDQDTGRKKPSRDS